MTIRLSTVHEDAHGIPLLLKEGLGVVDREVGTGAHHPLTPPPPRRGVAFMAGGADVPFFGISALS
jgi:hypothetical protein